MGSIVAGGKGGSFLKAEAASPYYLHHWYIPLLFLDLGTDLNSGASGVGKKTLCDLLSMEFGFPQISLDKVLCEKSQDQTYLHVQYIKDCLAEDVDVATQLAVNLLGKKINEVNTWSLMLGFPERMEQVVEFERMVGMTYEESSFVYGY